MFFSVIIPLFDKGSYLSETIRSISAQSFSDFEIIVVDDGSTDDSSNQVRAMNDPRLRLMSQDNAGPGPARNLGCESARGEWLAFIDADDVWAANHLAVLRDLILSAPDCNVVATTSRQFDDSQIFPAQMANQDVIHRVDYLADGGERFVHTSSIAIRKATFFEIGKFGAFFPGEDTELWVRLALQYPFVISTANTSGYRRATNGIMEQLEKLNEPPVGPGEAPAQVFLEAALMNPDFALRHAAIRAYLDRARLRVAKIALVRGYPSVARSHLKAITSQRKTLAGAYLALTLIPGPIFRTIVWSLAARRRIYQRFSKTVSS